MDRVEGESMKTNKEIAHKILDRIYISSQLSETEMIRTMNDFESHILQALRLKDEEVKKAIQKTLRKKGKCYCVFCLSQGQYCNDCVVTELESLLASGEEVKA